MRITPPKTERYCRLAERAQQLVCEAIDRCRQRHASVAEAGNSVEELVAQFHEAGTEARAACTIAMAAWDAG